MIVSGMIVTQKSNAQVSVGINVNIGAQPAWGPVGYDHVDYYYMPDIDVYYNVPQRQYIYLDGGRWIYSAGLPMRCRNYDIYRGYKVVVNEPRPFMRNDFYREKYRNFRGNYGRQVVLRDGRGWGKKDWDRRDRDRGDWDRRGDHDHGHGNGHGHGRGHWDRD